jgi:hypothetical protein
MTIQLPCYIQFYKQDPPTVFHQLQFFVLGDSLEDVLSQLTVFVADYQKYMEITHGKFSKVESSIGNISKSGFVE